MSASLVINAILGEQVISQWLVQRVTLLMVFTDSEGQKIYSDRHGWYAPSRGKVYENTKYSVMRNMRALIAR